MKTWLVRRWYSSRPAPWFLLPLSALFGGIVQWRRRRQQLRQEHLSAPVIVVGNIAIGGTGKTPFVIWLVQRLREWGWRPGVISRGYGGKSAEWPCAVTPASDPAEVGDEPVLIARRAACPVVVGLDRVAAARSLLANADVNIIVSDDGLQHYRLARDLEIAVVDSSRGLGNGHLLPAGPLREPPARLRELALVVVNGEGWSAAVERQVRMRLGSLEAVALKGAARRAIVEFRGKSAHAVAGIGNPARFFSMLREQGIQTVEHPFPDHHPFTAADIEFGDGLPVLMTEKDAVKCAVFAQEHHWLVPVDATIDPAGTALVQELVHALKSRAPHG